MNKRHRQTATAVGYLLALTAGVALLQGCSTQTALKDIDATQHQITTTSQTNGKATLKAVNTAFNYCYALDKRIVMTDIISNYQAIGMPKHFIYSATVYFHCAEPWKNA